MGPTNNQHKAMTSVASNVRKTPLMLQTETYTNALISSLGDMNIDFTNYQKICVINCLQKMKEMLVKEGMDFKNADQSNITTILQQVAMLQLNVAASPRECYLQWRNWKDKNEQWHKDFEFGVEGDGNDKILRTYGVDVKSLKGAFIVREGDEFTYPSFDGEKICPPTWKAHSYSSSPVKVFYIIDKIDGTREFLISEREEVVKNIQAHITNNMMKETKETKARIVEKMANMKLDDILNDKELRNWISPAWYNPQSRNDMIIRKMRNNATKKYPKDFKNAFVESNYEKTFEDYDQYSQTVEKPNPIEAVETEYTEVNNSVKPQPVGIEHKEETPVNQVAQSPVVEEELPY